MIICASCCCGVVSRRKPEVPVGCLKQQWRARGLLKKVLLMISRCLGPCDLTNVAKVSGPNFEVWLGKISRFAQASLLECAEQCKAPGTLLRLPSDFDQFRFSPFEPTIK
jgi:cobaltochelatase CobN